MTNFLRGMKNKVLDRKINLLLYILVLHGNPNGDPNAAGMPRQLARTGHGYFTDVCCKRLIRDCGLVLYEDDPDFDIFVRDGVALDGPQKEAMAAVPRPGGPVDDKDNKEKGKKKPADPVAMVKYAKDLKAWMCRKYFDVRAFGAVCQHLTKKSSEGGAGIDGSIVGPFQMSFCESLDPVEIEEVAITRCALANQEEKDKDKNNTMGIKYMIPFGLYEAHCSISPDYAKQTGFTYGDLEHLLTIISRMYDMDKSSMRGEVSLRKMILFEHESKYGNAPDYKCYGSVLVKKKDGVVTPVALDDYVFTYLDTPNGVTRTVLIDD